MEDGEVDEGGDLEASEQATEFLGEQVPMRVCCITHLGLSTVQIEAWLTGTQAHSSEAHHRGPNVTENDTANASGNASLYLLLDIDSWPAC